MKQLCDCLINLRIIFMHTAPGHYRRMFYKLVCDEAMINL